MVVVGGFSVQIVDATTKKPFLEHTKQNNINNNKQYFVEAEPEAEYFIELQVVGDIKDEMKKRRFSFRCFVDGKPMGSRVTLRGQGQAYRVGWFSIRDGTQEMKALRWTSPTASSNGSGSKDEVSFNAKQLGCSLEVGTNGMMGSVTVQVFEALLTGMRPATQNFQHDFNTSPANAPCYLLAKPYEYRGKSMLRTDVGSTTESSSPDSRLYDPPPSGASDAVGSGKEGPTVVAASTTNGAKTPSFEPGTFLQEIKITYCTTLGLIHAGVLDKPPLWDYVRLKEQNRGKKRSSSGDADQLLLDGPEPTKRICIPAVYEGNLLISPPKTVELFDLTTDTTTKDKGGDGRGNGGSTTDPTDTYSSSSSSNSATSSMDDDPTAAAHAASIISREGGGSQHQLDQSGSARVCVYPKPSILLGRKGRTHPRLG